MKFPTILTLVAGCLAFAIASLSNITYATDCVTPGCESSTKHGTDAVKKDVVTTIKYSILNGSGKTVSFTLPSGKRWRLKPGQRGNYKNTGHKKDLTIYVHNSGRTYNLVSGSHKFWWIRKENRIGFDLNF